MNEQMLMASVMRMQIAEKNYTRLCSTTSILTVNGQFPGPVIRVHKGDKVYVKVSNQGDYGVTLHWYIYALFESMIIYIVRT